MEDFYRQKGGGTKKLKEEWIISSKDTFSQGKAGDLTKQITLDLEIPG